MIHFNIRLEEDRLCTFVILGARSDGTKELIAVEDGFRDDDYFVLKVKAAFHPNLR